MHTHNVRTNTHIQRPINKQAGTNKHTQKTVASIYGWCRGWGIDATAAIAAVRTEAGKQITYGRLRAAQSLFVHFTMRCVLHLACLRLKTIPTRHPPSLTHSRVTQSDTTGFSNQSAHIILLMVHQLQYWIYLIKEEETSPLIENKTTKNVIKLDNLGTPQHVCTFNKTKQKKYTDKTWIPRYKSLYSLHGKKC